MERLSGVAKLMSALIRTSRRRLAPLKRALLYHRRRPLRESHDSSDTVLLASAGRSGSSWIGNLLNWQDRFRYLFEPLHPQWVSEFSDEYRHGYLPKTSSGSRLHGAVEDAICGVVTNPWTDQFNRNRTADRRLVKAIRANLALPWIAKHLDAKIVFLLRNPLAQALSASDGNWNLTMDFFTEQDDFASAYPKLAEDLKTPSFDPFLNAVQFWCVENFVPMLELSEQDAYSIQYEKLVLDTELELRKLFEFADVPFSDEVLELAKVRSSTARAYQGGDPLTRWKDRLSQSQLHSALEILKRFGFAELYDDNGVPCADLKSVREQVNASQYNERNHEGALAVAH